MELELKPTYRLVSHYLEVGLRKEDSELIYDGLKKFDELGFLPHYRTLKKLGQLRHMPDDIYVILKNKFPKYGWMTNKVR